MPLIFYDNVSFILEVLHMKPTRYNKIDLHQNDALGLSVPEEPETDTPPPYCHEMQHIEQLRQYSSPLLKNEKLGQVEHEGHFYPIYSFTLGNKTDTNTPAIAFVGGVHGVERIGTQVVLAFLETLLERLQWDDSLNHLLHSMRLIFIPLVNPVGMSFNTRANGQGVDLMRNAPIDAEQHPAFMVGGQRITRKIAWYRGDKDSPMETEAEILCSTIKSHLFNSPFSLVLDVHSGFGFHDRVWFPYAYTKEPVEHLAEIYSLRQLMQKTYPYMDYLFEPQAHTYTTHGDLWDYMYKQSLEQKGTFIPLTLEMGSWKWVKKNPKQFFSLLGLFNPMIPHRIQRVLRRHTTLMEFLIRATASHRSWQPSSIDKTSLKAEGLKTWYCNED